MRLRFPAALALLVTAPLRAQDLGTATPIAGTWSYTTAADGTEARFNNATSNPQLWIHCVRATRRVTIARPASTAAPFISLWTSSRQQNVPSAFNPATGRLIVELGAYDPMLDAMVSSRGRVGFTVTGQPPLVVPPWPEIARVVEDCRV